jgi:hypothetical protein
LDLLSYLHAMIYHERNPAELESRAETIENSVKTDDHRQEIHVMGQTIAEKLIAEGMEKGELQSLKRMLLLVLRKRFGKQAAKTEAIIEQVHDPRQVETWLERFATARTIRDVGIRGN